MAGLDCVWTVEGGGRPRFDPPLTVLYPDGRSSGRVYEAAIRAITGHSLFQDEISSEEVRAIAESLADFSPDEEFFKEFGLTTREFQDLERLFVGYAGLGARLVALW